ncbi:hypothetical protein [Moraxella sp. Pampa]|uniref:hypothetical protein n=1 Tax=Moraxella sp. Pampa TaxID=3111978 RepID=UPI002B40ABFB|nr:hypothetical protein [Moraxella sp. Pampa]
MTDRLSKRLRWQFEQDAKQKQPPAPTTQKVLAHSTKSMAEAERTIARYNEFVINRPSNARLIAQGAADGLVWLGILVGWFFIVCISLLAQLSILAGFGII